MGKKGFVVNFTGKFYMGEFARIRIRNSFYLSYCSSTTKLYRGDVTRKIVSREVIVFDNFFVRADFPRRGKADFLALF
jgi:hypothetical protein